MACTAHMYMCFHHRICVKEFHTTGREVRRTKSAGLDVSPHIGPCDTFRNHATPGHAGCAEWHAHMRVVL
eukprot:30326-Prymnesium_polylepis.2